MSATGLWTDSLDVFEKFPLFYRLSCLRLLAPRAQVFIETTNFTVQTVSDPSELKEIFRLRYDVFYREFAGRGDRWALLPYDVDLFDFACDHLVVKEKKSGSIIATYRLLFQEQGESRHFYNETEFDLTEFRKIPGNKLELGRACVHRDFRTGAVISLLWKGLCQYARRTQTRYMFGCSSLCRPEFGNLPHLLEQLERRDSFLRELPVPVKKNYTLAAHPGLVLPAAAAPEKASMPSLMNMYLLAGARIGREYAYDEDLDCLDFFTVLDFTKLPASFERRFA